MYRLAIALGTIMIPVGLILSVLPHTAHMLQMTQGLGS